MRIFVCAGEPSGDLHGANLVRSLRRLRPDVECVGFGGERMEAAGCRLLYPLCRLAVMGFVRLFGSLHQFAGLVSWADRYFRRERPDAVVLIDFPGFNWWMARRAHFRGIPVFYFVPPQLWGWAGWRVNKMRRWVDHVLCTLPFEEPWYHARGVPAHYVGHPYFDELAGQRLDREFLARQRESGKQIIGLLPGSRTQEVHNNLSTLVRSAVRVHGERPDTHFLVACFKPAHRQYVDGYLRGRDLPFIETCVGRTPEIIELAVACVAVSGSVGLELLYRGTPTAVVYQTNAFYRRIVDLLKAVPYISLVNLLADRELFPEFLSDRCEAAIAGHLLRWLNDPAAYAAITGELAALRERVAEPGACARAAGYIVNQLEAGRQRRAA